jgi:hypothetical protein
MDDRKSSSVLFLKHLRELIVCGLEHVQERQCDAGLDSGLVARHYPLLEVEAEVLWEGLHILHSPAHGVHEAVELERNVALDAEG